MSQDLFGRYVWIVDTLTRYESLSRDEINRLWKKSSFSKGDPLPERTFFHYRRAIEKNFNIDIACDRQGRYYIEKDKGVKNKSFTNLMLDSYAVGSALRDSPVSPGRVEVEDVPSAREFLPQVMEAMAVSKKIVFTYSGFNRSRSETDILFSPYFLKRYKQRWYMIGMKEKGKSIRTYALDRVKEMKLTPDAFEMPSSMKSDDLFGNIVGVTTSEAPVKTVKLYTTSTQAKYFRALPLHPSQKEETHEDYSIFTYRLKLNYELTHEILGFGDSVKVLEPPELKAMVLHQIKNTLSLYEETDGQKPSDIKA